MSLADELQRLNEMKQAGVLTDSEFATASQTCFNNTKATLFHRRFRV